MSHVVEPLFVEWGRFAACHRSRLMLTHLRNNRVAWQRQQVSEMTSSMTSSQPSIDSSRRHSLPAAPGDAPRRHSEPSAAPLRLSVGGLSQLDALNECSLLPTTQSNGHFQFSDERQANDTSTDHLACVTYLPYLALLADRRLSLNNYCAHAQRALVTSRRRSRSLVSPCSHGVAFEHPAKPLVTSSPITRMPGLFAHLPFTYV